MRTKVYDEYVNVTGDLDSLLKKCFVNHLVIYNYSLALLYQNNGLDYKTLRKCAVAYIEEKKISPVFDIALFNEIYYQYKKFKRNIKIQKLISDIQYFTFLMNGYNDKILTVNQERNGIQFENMPGSIILDKELPNLTNELIYLNLSFSNLENRYKLSIYVVND